MIALKYCTILWTDEGCDTCFNDGTVAGSTWHDTPHYHVASHRVGLGDNLLLFARSHEFFHSFVEEWMHDRPSQVLWGVAHNKMLSGKKSAYEEIATVAAQRWIHANELPIISGVQWHAFKAKAIELMGDLT
jgi:hypothetical protein